VTVLPCKFEVLAFVQKLPFHTFQKRSDLLLGPRTDQGLTFTFAFRLVSGLAVLLDWWFRFLGVSTVSKVRFLPPDSPSRSISSSGAPGSVCPSSTGTGEGSGASGAETGTSGTSGTGLGAGTPVGFIRTGIQISDLKGFRSEVATSVATSAPVGVMATARLAKCTRASAVATSMRGTELSSTQLQELAR